MLYSGSLPRPPVLRPGCHDPHRAAATAKVLGRVDAAFCGDGAPACRKRHADGNPVFVGNQGGDLGRFRIALRTEVKGGVAPLGAADELPVAFGMNGLRVGSFERRFVPGERVTSGEPMPRAPRHHVLPELDAHDC